MTVLARRVASIPVRSASATWEFIVDLLAHTNGEARAELLAATGIVASLVARESMVVSPVVVVGDGPRVRIYCIHGEKAVEGTGVNEATLPESPVGSGSWAVSLPCPAEDLPWVQKALGQISTRITGRDLAESFSAASDEGEQVTAAEADIDLESFLRP